MFVSLVLYSSGGMAYFFFNCEATGYFNLLTNGWIILLVVSGKKAIQLLACAKGELQLDCCVKALNKDH